MFQPQKAKLFFKLFEQNKFDRLHRELLSALQYFNKKVFINFGESSVQEIDCFLEILFYLLLQNRFSINPHLKRYLSYTPLLENLAYISSYGTTNLVLKKLMQKQQHDLSKILFMLNLKTDFDLELIEDIFSQNNEFASYWLYTIFTRYTFFNDVNQRHLEILQDRLINYDLSLLDNICSLYFNSTYINHHTHLQVRAKINTLVKRATKHNKIINKTCKGRTQRIAVISENWHIEHAVYKCIGSFIQTLSEKYELCLVQLNTQPASPVPDYFNKVYRIGKNSDSFDYSSIAENDFNLAIFPDIGLNTKSILLANMRIAPIQIAMYGHPVSSASSEIDYFLVGTYAETDDAQNYYYEKLIKMHGTGMNSVQPKVKRIIGCEKNAALSDEIVNIIVSSSALKINSTIKHYWKKIIKQSNRKTVLHFLPGDAAMQELSVLRYELEKFIGLENIRFYPRLNYENYMAVIKKCELSLGSYHYGDYNRVVDALWMGTPFVAVKGDCGFQNTGIAALHAVGLDELIASDLDEYVDIALKLIADKRERRDLQHKIMHLPIDKILIENDDYNNEFKKIISGLIS